MMTVVRSGTGTCLWCAGQKEGVEVEFTDGSLKGFLCKADFWKLVKTRSIRGKENPVGDKSERVRVSNAS